MRHQVGPAFAVAALLLAGRAGAEPVTLRAGTIAPDGSPYAEGAKGLARAVAKTTRDGLRIRVFAGGLLGDEPDMVAALAAGRLDIFVGTSAALHRVIPELEALDLPFLFRDEAEVDQVMQRIFPVLAGVIQRRGYLLAALSSVGFKHLGTQKPVTTLAELRRVRLRSQPSPMQERLWTLAGIPHRPIGQTRVLDELAAGTVDGFDAAVTWMFAASWHTHIKHLTLSAHIYQAGMFVVGPAALARLSPAQRDSLRAGEAMGWENVRDVRAVERSLLETLPGMGVAIHSMPPALRAELEGAALGLRAEWRKTATRDGKKLLQAIEAEVARLRQ